MFPFVVCLSMSGDELLLILCVENAISVLLKRIQFAVSCGAKILECQFTFVTLKVIMSTMKTPKLIKGEKR